MGERDVTPLVPRGHRTLELAFCAIVALVSGALVFPIVPGILLLSRLGTSAPIPRPFDAELWNTPDWEDSMREGWYGHSIRQRMAQDLVDHHLPLGTPRDAVLALLGPRAEGYAAQRFDADAWVYELGPGGGFGPTYDYLVLTFSADGALLRAEIATRNN